MAKKKIKILINNDYGGFALKQEAVKWLMEQGYSEEQAKDIRDGDCPRDLPILMEAFLKFGQEPLVSDIVAVKLEKGTKYYIDRYDGLEEVITVDNMSEATGEVADEWKPKNVEN